MRLTTQAIYDKKKKRKKIVALTAYDYLFARILDDLGLDIVLVGDSVGMVLLGHETTIPVTMDDMIHHCRAVSRGVVKACVVADMPYRSYETPQKALRNARRLIKEGGANAVKLEGGEKIRRQVKELVDKGIPVMGHVGMLPQSVKKAGGYRVQGKSAGEAERILKDAHLLCRLGAFAIVLECIPRGLAKEITRQVQCPTIGIGAGAGTNGQVLVLHDMLGLHGKVSPRFVRRYACLEEDIRSAVRKYRDDVADGKFPSVKESF